MKKVVLIVVFALIAFYSCEKINLVEQVPQLKGPWQWHQSFVGGVVGVINANTEKNVVFVFEDDNKINIEYNGEIVVSGETYTCKKSNNCNYGEYVISLPKEVKSKVAECLGVSKEYVVIDGYIHFSTLYTNDDTVYLVITEVGGKNIGVEGGNDFHCSSVFAPIPSSY